MNVCNSSIAFHVNDSGMLGFQEVAEEDVAADDLPSDYGEVLLESDGSLTLYSFAYQVTQFHRWRFWTCVCAWQPA